MKRVKRTHPLGPSKRYAAPASSNGGGQSGGLSFFCSAAHTAWVAPSVPRATWTYGRSVWHRTEVAQTSSIPVHHPRNDLHHSIATEEAWQKLVRFSMKRAWLDWCTRHRSMVQACGTVPR